MVFEHQPKEVIAQTEIDGEFRSDFPVVLDEAAIIVLAVVCEGDVGDVDLAGTANIVDAVLTGTVKSSHSARRAVRRRKQEEISAARYFRSCR